MSQLIIKKRHFGLIFLLVCDLKNISQNNDVKL